MKIPKLYETEETSLEDKMIYQKWELPHVGFYWLIAEYDPNNRLAFGYANLNDDEMAEWGYINIDELEENDAVPVDDWKPVKFGEIER
ncbi:MAG: DUF2958 domain-containing protein [Euryarchaeota archaeon]|nr:DUF2958 domain-containing protein [Euryarchaeota archaeon]MBU4032948.1 DUF2958 domain-containing protein [Candidatus Thermoplasmatota archaeon]MBU4144248.1 DUF2958 domain-containing protein [Candidatus Thermoplasmatota archaeon]